MRLEVDVTNKNCELFQRWLSDQTTREFMTYLRSHYGVDAFSQGSANKITKTTINLVQNATGTNTICEVTLRSSSTASTPSSITSLAPPAHHHHHFTPYSFCGFNNPLNNSSSNTSTVTPRSDCVLNNTGPVADQIVSSCTRLRSSIVDLWPARSIHVTSLCDRGADGQSCQATHFGLSDSLFDDSLPPLGYYPSDMSSSNGASNSASSSWKATFMSTRERFSSPAANPIQLKLGGPSGQKPAKKWGSSAQPQTMSTSDDWSSFEKLFGGSHPNANSGNSLMVTSTGSSRSRLTPSPTPSTGSQIPVANNLDDAMAKEIETRFVALNDLIRGIAFLGTNGAAPGPGGHAARSVSPTPLNKMNSSSSLNQNAVTGGQQPQRSQPLPRTSATVLSSTSSFQIYKSSSFSGSTSSSSTQSFRNFNSHASGTTDSSFRGNASPIGVNSHHRVPPPNLDINLGVNDISKEMTTSTDILKNEAAMSPGASHTNNMALKIIDEVQQFLQTNTETLKKSGRFPQSHSPQTPSSPINKTFSNLSDQLTRQVVDERYPTAAPLSPSASSAVRRAMLDHHQFHFHHRSISSSASSSLTPRQHHVSTGSVAERVNQFELVRQKRTEQSTIRKQHQLTNHVIEDKPSYFHFQLPNSVAGVSASIIHQPSIVSTAASSKLTQNGTYQPKKDVPKVDSTQTNGSESQEKRDRAAVLNEIEKALQELPAGTSKASSTATATTSNEEKAQRISSPKPAIVNGTTTNGPTAAQTSESAPTPSKIPRVSLRSLLNRKSIKQPNETAEAIINKTANVFRTLPSGKAELVDFGRICRACGLPGCLKKPLFNVCCGPKKNFAVQYDLTKFWTSMGEDAGDEAAVLVRLLSSSNSQHKYLVPDDLVALVQCVVDDHPGLAFLREAPEFHSRYIQTVIARVFFNVNRSWSGRLTAAELRRSNLFETLHRLDEEEDINRITDYFSYEHFYVIYCKFWELDRDHDLLIDKEDLARFDDYALSRRAIDRVFSPALNNDRRSLDDGKMTYPQFVKFILAEKDKRHPTSTEYWFRCMDFDGDGFLSIYELQHFYDEQADKMILCGIEPMPFVDILCQVMDMVRPRLPLKITLADIKQCKMAHVFFDTFLNLHKYLEHEQMESGGVNAAMKNGKEGGDNSINEWNLYAAEEYEALVAEEADLGTEIKCDESDEEDR